jgi:hypothetical protein
MSFIDKVALPGDEDLNLDLDGCGVSSVVVFGREVMITLERGSGWMICDRELEEIGVDGSPQLEETTLMINAELWPDIAFNHVVGVLSQWNEEHALVRFTSAPGRLSVLMLDEGHWIPIGHAGVGHRA